MPYHRRNARAIFNNQTKANMRITVKAIQLQNLLDVHKQQQKCDACLSDYIEIELVEATDTHNKSDKVKFSGQSIYAECDNHFLGTN